MLHILWLILKWILIILGVLLGLLLLAVLLILFCPVRYRAEGEKKGSDPLQNIHGSFQVSWLFHIIAFEAAYGEGTLTQRIRIFGIPLDALQRLWRKVRKPAPVKEEKSPQQERPVQEFVREKPPTTQEPDAETPVVEEPEPPAPEERPTKEAYTPEDVPEPEEAHIPEDVPEPKEAHIPESENTEEKESSGRFWGRIKNIVLLPARIFGKVWDAIRGFFGKIRKIALTFREMYDKIEWWKAFLSHPRTQEAMSLVWNDAKALIRHVLPTRTEGKVTFGSEDPAVTGSVLAFLGMTIPFHKNCIEIVPLFDGENYLEGVVKIRGRIYGWMFLKTAVEIYFNKNVKYVIHRWRHKEV